MVLKPSEIAPLSGIDFAHCMHEAGFPAGVFNLVNGDGAGVGSAMSAHEDIDFISFTGSARAGILISKSAADTIKRVSLELGGKSPNIVFADSDLDQAIARGIGHCFDNTGQSCNAPTRMLVERSVYAEGGGHRRQARLSRQGRHIRASMATTSGRFPARCSSTRCRR